uniref:Uncharacterized protein n=1 Tax=Ditylenchus dipsaci TaxID=166011 RepID=A0A915EV42_9BILA
MFYRYGRAVSKHPWPFVVLPLLFTLAMSTGFLHLESVTDAVYLFTPRNAPSKYERQAVHDLEVQITVRVKDENSNILSEQNADAVVALDRYIQEEVKVVHRNKTYRYTDLCLSRENQGCPGNKHVHIISKLHQHNVNISYPTVELGNARGYIGSSLGGVTAFYGKDNATMNLAGAKSWLMVYHLQFYPAEMLLLSGLWEKAFQKALEEYPENLTSLGPTFTRRRWPKSSKEMLTR